MKKTYIVAVCLAVVIAAANAQELQLSGGFDYGIVFYDVDNSFLAPFGYGSDFYVSQKSKSLFLAPGISFMMRIYPEKPANALGVSGFFFRDRMLLVTNAKETGDVTVALPNSSFLWQNEWVTSYTEKVSREWALSGGGAVIIIGDFAMGLTSKLDLSERFSFIADIGVNITIASFIYDALAANENDTLMYTGAGLFDELGLQINLTKTIYLELGFNVTLNFIAYQEGEVTFPSPRNNGEYKKVKYEDTGRSDLGAVAPYLHIGWRIDFKPLKDAGLIR
ncbi:MAG: hypothetical protein Pg6C_16310 [Treponemataceae bacterium]|nr:MAG: hypothetical protein Pg6C_16310 [Treponemataceae bacterium]